ncbi:MAG TPA: hypothetical protein VNP72_05565, partial [Longimicrobium sp.]|nr:hypothetical protein [Longimicrobium sp.]
MIEWMLRAMAAAALLTVAALAVERAAAWLGRPRRWVWAAAMAASLLVPAAGVVAPGLLPRVDLLPRPLASAAAPTAAAAMGVPGGMMVDGAAGSASLAERASQVLAWGWLTASLVMLTAFGWAGLRLRLARDAWRPARVDGTRVLVAERAGPAVVGLRRPEIVIPRWVLEAAPGERALILRHERE